MEDIKITDCIYSSPSSYALWAVKWSDKRDFVQGFVATLYGYVNVYSEKGNLAHTSFRFISEGIEYYRAIPKNYKERYLITLAKRYAEEISLKSKRQKLINSRMT